MNNRPEKWLEIERREFRMEKEGHKILELGEFNTNSTHKVASNIQISLKKKA
jgi:hypothetical protein